MNALKELTDLLKKDLINIKCATIDKSNYLSPQTPINLKVDHNAEAYREFLESLNFNYDNGFGRQELYGTIWMNDGTWLIRGEYDGSEWWEWHSLPEIPIDLLNEPTEADFWDGDESDKSLE